MPRRNGFIEQVLFYCVCMDAVVRLGKSTTRFLGDSKSLALFLLESLIILDDIQLELGRKP